MEQDQRHIEIGLGIGIVVFELAGVIIDDSLASLADGRRRMAIRLAADVPS